MEPDRAGSWLWYHVTSSRARLYPETIEGGDSAHWTDAGRPAFAMTVCMSRVQSLKYVGVRPKEQVFVCAQGQPYVAASRMAEWKIPLDHPTDSKSRQKLHTRYVQRITVIGVTLWKIGRWWSIFIRFLYYSTVHFWSINNASTINVTWPVCWQNQPMALRTAFFVFVFFCRRTHWSPLVKTVYHVT